jgi:alpha-D-ribose 1-methylphosphonate 5-triphosphate synthase subunit PhnH
MADVAFSNDSMSSAHAFRIILDCMAKPGHVATLGGILDAPEPLYSTTATIAQTLFDFQSPVWLGSQFANRAIEQHLKFYSGVPLVRDPKTSAFAVASAMGGMPRLSEFAQGNHEYPDRSTTVIIQVAEFSTGDVVLSGPGLKQPVSFGAKPLDANFWQEMMANHQQYPLGVDVIFVSPSAIACCPRSTKIAVQENA